MNKTLKFAPDLVPLVLSGEKTSTWRLWDEKGLAVGDTVDFYNKETGDHFATATLVKVIEKSLGELTEEDKKGHEKFENDEAMYKAYTAYYHRSVDKTTSIKLITFELISQ